MKLKIITEQDAGSGNLTFEDEVNAFCKNKNVKSIQCFVKHNEYYVAFITYFETEESTTL